VLLLSRIVRRNVCGPDGLRIGHVADVTARLGLTGESTVVDRILVARKHEPHLLVPLTAVSSLQHHDIVLTLDGGEFTIGSLDEALETGEILLVRDVLDTQIVDIAGQRLARVADVVLGHRRDGSVEIIGVEVGFGAVLRRLGLGWLAKRAGGDAVAWTDLHLTSERGHDVQLATPRSAVHLLDARGLAMLITQLDTESAAEVLAARGTGAAAEVIRASHPAVGERILRAMSDTEAAGVVAAMPAHHATHWRRLLSKPRTLQGRHFRRFGVWPRRRHVPGKAWR
jgi:sporulation protein YlmC with PRC-barrel domain